MRKYRGQSQATTRQERDRDTLPSRAARIVEDADLLREVLRRACFIDPKFVKAALQDAEKRIDAVREGGYVERYSTPP